MSKLKWKSRDIIMKFVNDNIAVLKYPQQPAHTQNFSTSCSYTKESELTWKRKVSSCHTAVWAKTSCSKSQLDQPKPAVKLLLYRTCWDDPATVPVTFCAPKRCLTAKQFLESSSVRSKLVDVAKNENCNIYIFHYYVTRWGPVSTLLGECTLKGKSSFLI